MKKTVLITGTTGKLGQYLAETLTNVGYEVIINYRKNESVAKKLAKKIGAKLVVRSDVTKLAEVKKMFKAIGPVDVLINNVGGFIWKPLSETSEQEFHDMLHSNLLSAWYCAKAALPGMRKQKFGRIINFGSAGCDQITTRPMTTPYYIAKTGLLILTKSLAKEEGKNGITINMVSPGVLASSVVRPPGAPIIQFDDIAKAVLFLISQDSPHVNGANLEVTGGWRPE